MPISSEPYRGLIYSGATKLHTDLKFEVRGSHLHVSGLFVTPEGVRHRVDRKIKLVSGEIVDLVVDGHYLVLPFRVADKPVESEIYVMRAVDGYPPTTPTEE